MRFLSIFIGILSVHYSAFSAQTEYDRIYPFYAEICASSKYGELDDKGNIKSEGGPMGHSVLYLKGACIDSSKGYPRLKRCGEKINDISNPNCLAQEGKFANCPQIDLSDENYGSGVSVNPQFGNVNWVGIPGKDLFLNGMVSANQPINKTTQQIPVQMARKLKLYDGILPSPTYAKGKNADNILSEGLGTDYAFNFGRNVLCAKIPMNETMIRRAIKSANRLNDKYAANGLTYTWTMATDNCAHATHNILAGAGVWAPKDFTKTPVGYILDKLPIPIPMLESVLGLGELAVPANEVVRAVEKGNDNSNFDFLKILSDRFYLRLLEEHGILPVRPGTLLEKVPFHSFENSLYKTSEGYKAFDLIPVLTGEFYNKIPHEILFQHIIPFLLGSPLDRYQEFLDTNLDNPNLTDLNLNLIYFKNKYQGVKEIQNSPGYQRMYEIMARNVSVRRLHDIYEKAFQVQMDFVDQNIK